MHEEPKGRSSPLRETDDPTPRELYERPHWYACRTRARAEKRVEERLAASELEAFLPLVERERAWADRTKRVALPLFPGFVFARFRLSRLHPVLETPGVTTVLRPNGYPTPVRDEEIDSLRRLVAGVRETGALPEPADFLEAGEEVVVIDGPFRGMHGVLLEAKGRARVMVRISALRQASSVEVERGAVRSATGSRVAATT